MPTKSAHFQIEVSVYAVLLTVVSVIVPLGTVDSVKVAVESAHTVDADRGIGIPNSAKPSVRNPCGVPSK